jgi:hypothetical protein
MRSRSWAEPHQKNILENQQLDQGEDDHVFRSNQLAGGKKSYAEVVQGMEHTLSLNFQTIAGTNKVGEVALEKINGRNSLVHALSADMEEKEKAGIMTGEKQVGVESVRELLADFKKDLLKCLEGYLAGWTPPDVTVNWAKKRAVIGGPKLRKEKPKPPVKLTYSRKAARPKLRWQKIERPKTTKKHSPESSLTQANKSSGAVRILEMGGEFRDRVVSCFLVEAG